MNNEQLAVFIGSIKSHADLMTSQIDMLRKANAANENDIWLAFCETLAGGDETKRQEVRRRLSQAQQARLTGQPFGKALLGLPQ